MRGRASVVLAAVVALGALAACTEDGPPPPAQTSAADAPVRSPTTTSPPPPALQRLDVRASVFGGPGDQRLVAVATALDAVVAVGSNDGKAAIWRSIDGLGWVSVALTESQFPPGSQLADVILGGTGFVAVGSVGPEPGVWVSPDGTTWRRALADGTGALSSVTLTDFGLLAFGTRTEAPGTGVWYSVDGGLWRPVADASAEFGGTTIVAAAESGLGLVALARSPEERAELWSSMDGTSWSAAGESGPDLLPAEGRQIPSALLIAGSTMVAAGSVEEEDGIDAALWTSTGGPWDRVPHDEGTFGGDGAQAVTAVTQDGGRLVAVGTDTQPDGGVDALLWVAQSGDWERAAEAEELAGVGDQFAADVTATGGRVVAVGWETKPAAGGTPPDTDAVAWVLGVEDEPPPEPETGPVIPWQRVVGQDDLGGDGEQRMYSVAIGPAGLVAVGTTAGDGLDGAVWRSEDGVTWERSAVLGGPADQYLLGVMTGGRGYVVVGADGPSAAVWLSVDGEVWTRAAGGLPVFDAAVARAVTVTPDGRLVAVGDDGAGAASAWVSDYGDVWQRAAIGSGTPTAVTGGPDGVVAVGHNDAGAAAWSSPDGLNWTGAVVGTGAFRATRARGPGIVAVGSAAGDGRDGIVWARTGADWVQAPLGGLGGAEDQELTALTSEEDLLVAVGWTGFGGGDDAASWASRDGIAWTRTPHDEGALGGDLDQRMEAVMMIDGVALAVGRSGSDAAVWIAPDAAAGGSASAL